jgi:hypothetical protein
MRNRRSLLVGALGVMLGALSPRLAAGQAAVSPLGWAPGRPAVEAAYTRLRLDGDGRSPAADGVGARLMWNLAPGSARDAGLRARTDLGLYSAFTPRQAPGVGPSFSALAAGVAADVRPFAAPLLGRVDPFVTVGAGVLRTNVAGARPVAGAPSPLLADSRTAFTLTPGVGVRVPLTPRLAAQGDLRNFMTFRDGTRHNVAFGAGLRLGF